MYSAWYGRRRDPKRGIGSQSSLFDGFEFVMHFTKFADYLSVLFRYSSSPHGLSKRDSLVYSCTRNRGAKNSRSLLE